MTFGWSAKKDRKEKSNREEDQKEKETTGEWREIYLAGGCFWGLEQYLQSIPGVKQTDVGYSNGRTQNPTYEQVCSQDTGHAETVRVVYAPKEISLPFLLDLFYEAIDPLSVNRQGGDVGTQYRTGIYYTDPEDLPLIEESLARLQQRFREPVAIETGPLLHYYRAEEYHQLYLQKHPQGYCHIGKASFQRAAQARVDPYAYEPASPQKLQEVLTPLQYRVTQNNATEPSFDNPFWSHREPGIYVDITTGEPLFSSTDKFESGCGWPSFSKPIDPRVLREHEDRSFGMRRMEVRSRVGDAHLGHVFEDGPARLGGLRYCINSASLRFIPKDKMQEEGYGGLLPLLAP